MNAKFSLVWADVQLNDKAMVCSDNILYSKIITIFSRNEIKTQHDYDNVMSDVLGYLHYEGFVDDVIIDEVNICDINGQLIDRGDLLAEI